MFRVPAIDRRLGTKDEILGVLLAARGGGRQAVAFSTAFLARTPVYHAAYEGTSLLVLTSPGGANRVFDSATVRFKNWLDASSVADDTGRRWRVTETALVAEGPGAPASLPRRPAFRAFWFGWFAQFPETELVK
jgi:hypothetical protein